MSITNRTIQSEIQNKINLEIITYNNNNNINYSDFKNDYNSEYQLKLINLILKKLLKTIGKKDYYPE